MNTIDLSALVEWRGEGENKVKNGYANSYYSSSWRDRVSSIYTLYLDSPELHDIFGIKNKRFFLECYPNVSSDQQSWNRKTAYLLGSNRPIEEKDIFGPLKDQVEWKLRCKDISYQENSYRGSREAIVNVSNIPETAAVSMSFAKSYYTHLTVVVKIGKFKTAIKISNFEEFSRFTENGISFRNYFFPYSECKTIGVLFDGGQAVNRENIDSLLTLTYADIFKYRSIPGFEHFCRYFVANIYDGEGLQISPSIKECSTALNRLKPLFLEIRDSHPAHAIIFNQLTWLLSKSKSGVKISTVFNQSFKDVKTKEDLVAILEPLYASLISKEVRDIEDVFTKLPTYIDSKRNVSKNSAIKKLFEIRDLTLDEVKYPLTYEALTSGEIPSTTLFRKSEVYFVENDNWELWEAMLKDHREVTIELAKAVSTRSTYERSLMSYFYFILEGLPTYLDKHARDPNNEKKWRCIPKFVNSSEELLPSETEGTTKTRSALTPIVDNENFTVTVPFAHLHVYGRNTTYCYAHNYVVLQKGLSFDGSVCTKDLEEKLNGVDDYGLMFYTLTGTSTARGYPSFLIIFERLTKDKTKVHFHRVNPMRSKDGDRNGVHNFTKACYNWMVGNVPFENIKVTQGDLNFVKTDKTLDFTNAKVVTDYDSHSFNTPVPFLAAGQAVEVKSNVLGYVSLEEDTLLNHIEHKERIIPKGVYQIRQARSFEANPRGNWSLRID